MSVPKEELRDLLQRVHELGYKHFKKEIEYSEKTRAAGLAGGMIIIANHFGIKLEEREFD
jgi:hypothetical protein